MKHFKVKYERSDIKIHLHIMYCCVKIGLFYYGITASRRNYFELNGTTFKSERISDGNAICTEVIRPLSLFKY